MCTPNVDKNDMRTTLEDAIRATGLEIEIRNILFHLIRSSVKSELKASIQPVIQGVKSSSSVNAKF